MNAFSLGLGGNTGGNITDSDTPVMCCPWTWLHQLEDGALLTLRLPSPTAAATTEEAFWPARSVPLAGGAQTEDGGRKLKLKSLSDAAICKRVRL